MKKLRGCKSCPRSHNDQYDFFVLNIVCRMLLVWLLSHASLLTPFLFLRPRPWLAHSSVGAESWFLCQSLQLDNLFITLYPLELSPCFILSSHSKFIDFEPFCLLTTFSEAAYLELHIIHRSQFSNGVNLIEFT